MGSGPSHPGHTFELRGSSGEQDRDFVRQLLDLSGQCIVRTSHAQHVDIIVDLLECRLAEARFISSVDGTSIDDALQRAAARAVYWIPLPPADAYEQILDCINGCVSAGPTHCMPPFAQSSPIPLCP